MGIAGCQESGLRATTGAFLAYLLIYPAVTGCDRSSPPAGGAAAGQSAASVAVVGPWELHPQWAGICGGAQRYAAAVPAVRVLCSAPTSATAERLLGTVQRALEQRPQAVCLYVVDPDAARASVGAILARQIVLVTIGQRPDDSRVYGHVGVDLAAGAELLGEHLSSLAAGRRSYLLVHESAAGPAATECCQRFMSAARRHIEPTLLQSVDAADSSQPPTELIESLLHTFPHAGLLVTLNPDVWLTVRAGWSRRLRELNGEFRFTTLAAAPVLWQRLGTPESPGEAAALVGPLDGEIGFAAVEIAARALLSTGSRTPVRRIPCELVTPENLPDFARRYAEAAGGLDVAGYLPTTRPGATRAARE